MQECHQRHGCSWRTCHRHSCCSYPCRRSRKPETFFWNRRRGCYFLAEASGLSCLQVWPSLLLPKICYKTYMCAKFVGHGVGPTSSKTPAIPCFLAFKNTISEVLLVKNYHTWKQKWRSKINSQVESDNIWRKKREFVATIFYYLLISGISFLYESSRPINVNLADATANFVSYFSTLSAGGYKIWWS